MQKIIKIIAACLSLIPAIACALPPGPILGIQLGETHAHLKTSTLGHMSADIRNFAFNGRIFIGNQVTSILGYEIGYLRVRNVRVLNINQTGQSGKVKQHALDALVRVNWRFAPQLDAIGRFGASYLIAVPDSTVRQFSNNDFSKKHIGHYRPAFGVGLSYKANFPVSVEASWLHLLEHRALAKLDFIAIGATLFTNGL